MSMLVRGGAAPAGSSLPATATAGQVLSWNGSAWVAATPSATGTTPNATPTVPGLVQLAGDLGGTATAPTVAKINGSTPAPVATSGKYSDLTGAPALATVATSGVYADLTGRPALATVATSGSYGDLTGRPALATVATSGSYGDLTGRPLLATVATSGSYTDLTNTPTVPTQYLRGKTAQTTSTVVTLASDPELVVASVAPGNYIVEVLLISASSSSAAGFSFAGSVSAFTWTGLSGSTPIVGLSIITAPTLSTTGRATTVTASMVVTAPGSFAVQYGSSSAGSAGGLNAGSWLRLTKVA